MSDDRRIDSLTPLMFCAIVAGIVLLLVFFLVPWPVRGDAADWVGENGILGIGLSALTLVGVAFASWGVYSNNKRSLETLNLARRADTAGRFHKGAELLGSEFETPIVAGIHVLADVAREAPDLYRKNVVRTLRTLITERNAPLIEQIYPEEYGDTVRVTPRPGGINIAVGPPWSPSGWVMATAVGAIARTPPEQRWGGVEHDDGRLRLRYIYLSRALLIGADLRGINFSRSFMGRVTFRGCLFENTVIDARVFDYVRFDGCVLTNCTLDGEDYGIIEDRSRAVAPPDGTTADVEKGRLSFMGCRLSDVCCNGEKLVDLDNLNRPLDLEY